MKPTSALLDCPEDILYLVFKSLSSADLYACYLVNKDLHTLVEPFLYSKIHWKWLEYETPPPINLLLRNILCRPQLATYIRSVILDDDTSYRTRFPGPVGKVTVSGAELDEFIAFIRRTRVPYGDLWIQELRHGTIAAFVALLLSQLSNVTYLSLGPYFTRHSRLIGMVLRSALCEPVDYGLPNFQHLEDVSFNVSVDDRRDKLNIKNTTDILPFFYLPTIQHISASIDNPVTFTWPAAHVPDPSRLTSLDLTFIREACLDQLLSVTRALKTLRWEWYYDYCLRSEHQCCTNVMDFDQIVAAISHVRDTLTDLTISVRCEPLLLPNPPFKTKGSLNALVNFDMLKRFQAPVTFLMGLSPDIATRLEDVIPRNIEFLTITDDLGHHDYFEWHDYSFLGMIQPWLENWKHSNPHLRGISLLLNYPEDGQWDSTMKNKFEEVCAQAGIQLQLQIIVEYLYH